MKRLAAGCGTHVKHRVSRPDVTLQKEIVSNVVQYLKADGTMMYSTCTLNPGLAGRL